jgi:DNA-binding NarL/FixJ family response regulator
MIRVVLADDHPVVRSGYQRFLEQAPDIRVVAEAGDGDAAYTAFLDHAPDVLVTDLSMPGGGGLELIRRVRLRERYARLLVFTMHDGPLLVRRALELGANGFVTKASAPESLLDALRAVDAGRRYLSPELSAPPPADPEADRMATLTDREFETFRLLAQGYSLEDCARVLKLSHKTVSNHQTSIKEKLEVPTLASLAHLALRHGVIASPDV